MSKPLDFTDEANPAWAAVAVDTFQVVPRPDPEEPVALELEGCCPRCKDHMRHTEFLIAFKGVSAMSPDALRETVRALQSAGVVNETLLPAEFSVRCCCQVKHPDRLGRAGLAGCGAIWKMRFESVGG